MSLTVFIEASARSLIAKSDDANTEGLALGDTEAEGDWLGLEDGETEGDADGDTDALADGLSLGDIEGLIEADGD